VKSIPFSTGRWRSRSHRWSNKLTSKFSLGRGLLLDPYFCSIGKMKKVLPVGALLEVLTTDAAAQARTWDLGLLSNTSQLTFSITNDKNSTYN